MKRGKEEKHVDWYAKSPEDANLSRLDVTPRGKHCPSSQTEPKVPEAENDVSVCSLYHLFISTYLPYRCSIEHVRLSIGLQEGFLRSPSFQLRMQVEVKS